MPTSVPGSDTWRAAQDAHGGAWGAAHLKPLRMRGFTMLELIIVVAIIAIASSVASLSLRDPAATRLERETQRLALLLEAARAQSRAMGVPIAWAPGPGTPNRAAARPGERVDANPDFRFIGAPDLGADATLPTRFLEAQTEDSRIVVELPNRQTSVSLGPEPLIGAQRIVLRLKEHQLILATDGLGPFVQVDQ